MLSIILTSGSAYEGNKTNVTDGTYKKVDCDNVRLHGSSFSGITTLQATRIDTDKLTFEITSTVTSGNLEIIIVIDGNYYSNVDINQTSTVVLEDIADKTVLIKIAGESADINIDIVRKY